MIFEYRLIQSENSYFVQNQMNEFAKEKFELLKVKLIHLEKDKVMTTVIMRREMIAA